MSNFIHSCFSCFFVGFTNDFLLSTSSQTPRGTALKDKITNTTLVLQDKNIRHWPLRWRCEKGKDFVIQPNSITSQRNLK